MPPILHLSGASNLDEQRRIVERLVAVREKAKALRAELIQALNDLNALLPSVLAKSLLR